MKKFLLLSGAFAVGVAANALTPRTAEDFAKKSEVRYEQARKGPRYAAETGKWLPGTIASYIWNSWETNAWELSDNVKLTYDEQGRKIKEERNNEVITYEYTSKGQISSETRTYIGNEGGYKSEYTYDEITGKEIGSVSYSLDGTKWVINDKWEYRISRDAQGNITRIDDYSRNYETGEMELAGYRVYTYGTDGKISEIINYDVDEGETEVEFHLKDIVWENTNGQLIVDDTNDMDADEYFMGANRVKSGILVDYDGDEGVTVNVSAEYSGDLGNVNIKMSTDNKVFYQYALTVLDSFGSYTEEIEDTDLEVEGGNISFGETYKENYTEKYDSYGILVEYVSETVSPSYSYSSKTTAEVTYDSTYGYPIEVINKGSSNGEEPALQSREVYGDYAHYTGISEVVADDDAEVEYYNLQGVRVSNPSNGIYIRRQGGKVAKIIVGSL
ncbi:hypothetical protein [uncultured Duncaniella sp.]|uniref:hypothetical protein n=1 Tax=uncultured Duncaniella sp. TaxID=2768039 RepID=UPI002604412B|nr:hypothetical protein [uncultured Duncaniella sp.]